MKVQKIALSSHAKNERLDRLTYIAVNIGFGETVIEHCMETKRECVTDTGIILVKDLHNEFLITAFVGTIDKISAIYHANGFERVPTHIYNKAQKNLYHVKMQNLVKY